jgi:hypothetical protein
MFFREHDDAIAMCVRRAVRQPDETAVYLGTRKVSHHSDLKPATVKALQSFFTLWIWTCTPKRLEEAGTMNLLAQRLANRERII